MDKESFSIFFDHLPSFSLSNFEGPLELLFYLAQKEEINLAEIRFKEITEQFMKSMHTLETVEMGSETLALAATLLMMKSRLLLPETKGIDLEEEENRIELMQHLLEYYRYKELAISLSNREEKQKAHYCRAISMLPVKEGDAIESIDLKQLELIFKNLLDRASQSSLKKIQGEVWQVQTKIESLRQELKKENKIPFYSLFSIEKSREELIVYFLALLELMKNQELLLLFHEEELYIVRGSALYG